MGATRTQLLCLQCFAQVNMPKPSAYGAETSSRPELACVQWLRKQERLLGLPAPPRVGMTKPHPCDDVPLPAGLCKKEMSLRVVTLLGFKK